MPSNSSAAALWFSVGLTHRDSQRQQTATGRDGDGMRAIVRSQLVDDVLDVKVDSIL